MKELQSDRGGEYTGHNFEFHLKKNGILHRMSVPYTPQQNGMAERLNQTLLNVTRCLLIHSGLPQSFWAKALQTASYIRNLYPSSAIRDSIPFELWNKRKLREHRHRPPEGFFSVAWYGREYQPTRRGNLVLAQWSASCLGIQRVLKYIDCGISRNGKRS
jgi:transposase InsO family protein